MKEPQKAMFLFVWILSLTTGGGVGYATMVAVVMASEIDESGINRLKINEVGDIAVPIARKEDVTATYPSSSIDAAQHECDEHRLPCLCQKAASSE
jgi:hypothetical protein